MRHPHGITRQILKQNLETMASTAPALGSSSRAKRWGSVDDKSLVLIVYLLQQ